MEEHILCLVTPPPFFLTLFFFPLSSFSNFWTKRVILRKNSVYCGWKKKSHGFQVLGGILLSSMQDFEEHATSGWGFDLFLQGFIAKISRLLCLHFSSPSFLFSSSSFLRGFSRSFPQGWCFFSCL